ncbi:MAG: FMN-binding negative transcriptional regulator [Geminicoccaceae bacterium]
MYVPKPFREERTHVLHQVMRDIGAAAVVGNGPDGLFATHVPVEILPEPAPYGRVRCHFAKPNPHGKAIDADQDLLVIFQGPQGYVTPSWYPSKKATGKVVPTWNYVAIHAYGRAQTFDDAPTLRRHLASLTERFESDYPEPWTLEMAPDSYITRMCKGIVGVEITITRLQGKWKMSQNKTDPDRLGVVHGLRDQGDGISQTLADLVEQAKRG